MSDGPARSPDRGFGKVAVLMGGHSAEREVSLRSGDAVLRALRAGGINAVAFDPAQQGLDILINEGVTHAFIALHGRGGEDGSMQGALETAEIPYTGSGVLGSALGMDKIRCKQIWQSLGIPTPEYYPLESEPVAGRIPSAHYPLMVKPAHEGSSIGMSRVENDKELSEAWREASHYDSTVFAERWITGAEYTAAVLQGQVLPMIRLETPREFYDYEAKYSMDTTRYICPCGLEPKREQQLGEQVIAAFEGVAASGWGRVDFIVDEHDQPWFIEVNTVPGMTDHSLVPMAAAAAGISFDELVLSILDTSLQRQAGGDA